jgi:hypothetical protein
MTCYECNDTGLLPIAPECAGDDAHNHHYILGRQTQIGRGGGVFGHHAVEVCAVKEDRVPYSEQLGHTDTASEEQDAVLSLEGRSGSFDGHVQVDETMNAARHSSETPSIPAYVALFPAANAVVHMEDSEAVLEERRDVAVPQV